MIRLIEIVPSKPESIAPKIIAYFYGKNAVEDIMGNYKHSRFVKDIDTEKIVFKLSNFSDWSASIQMLKNMDIQGLTINKDTNDITFDNFFDMDVMERKITHKDYQYVNFSVNTKYSTVGRLLEEIIFSHF